MKVTILAVGKLKESYWREATGEYLKRMRPYADVRVKEITDRDPSRGGEAKARAEEGEDLLKAIPEDSHVIALEIAAKQMTSEQFADTMERLAIDGCGHVVFVIGGSYGLSEAVLVRADTRLSFGAMTLPHNLARVVLVEQLYRSFRIRRGEPYHK